MRKLAFSKMQYRICVRIFRPHSRFVVGAKERKKNKNWSIKIIFPPMHVIYDRHALHVFN